MNQLSFSPKGTSIDPTNIEETEATAESNLNTIIEKPIIGLQSIDQIIYGLCPDMASKNIEKIQCLSGLIKTYFFGGNYIIKLIEDITNEDTSEFIEGIGILIKEQNITNIEELQIHFDKYINSFNPSKIC